MFARVKCLVRTVGAVVEQRLAERLAQCCPLSLRLQSQDKVNDINL